MPFSPEAMSEIAYAAHEETMNRRKPIILDRRAYPWYSFLLAHKREHHFTRGELRLKLQKDGGLPLEHFETGKDKLNFYENRVHDEMTYTPSRSHIGVIFDHTELEDEGNIVMPNQARGKNFAKKIPSASVDVLMDIFGMRIDDMMDAWDTRHDQTWHLDGAQDPLAPVGLDGLLPLDNTSGTIGGQPRTNPMYQHNTALALTTGLGGTLERGMQQVVRDSEVNNRGTPSRIDFIMAGWEFIDGYIAYARANNMPYERVGGNTEVKRMDIGVPDSAIHFNGIPIVHDPTFEVLDRANLYNGTTWTKRAYMLSSKTWHLGYQANKLKVFSAPMDPPDQRLTRLSLDGRHVPYITKPNGNGLVTIA